MWSDAAQAPPGHEADNWSSCTTTGICIPVFKNKGCRQDRKKYRNLVMLSVAAKLVARLVATRMAHWAEQYITEEQNGFLQKRGIDDAHPLARRMVVIAKHDYRIAITNFDIVRAYTRVCMDCTLDFVGSPWSPAILCPNTKSPPRTHTQFQVFISLTSSIPSSCATSASKEHSWPRPYPSPLVCLGNTKLMVDSVEQDSPNCAAGVLSTCLSAMSNT